MDAQPGLDGQRWVSRLGLRSVRLDHADQHIPRRHVVHLFQEFTLARLLGRQAQYQTDLLQAFVPRINPMSSCKTRALRLGSCSHLKNVEIQG